MKLYKLILLIALPISLLVCTTPLFCKDKTQKVQKIVYVNDYTLTEKIKRLAQKFSKTDNTKDSQPVAVAGVRGDNIYEQNKAQLKRDLYWEN